MTTICHFMIAKNEAHCIANAINSVAHVVDELVVYDTGSSDGTQDIVRALGGRVITGVDVRNIGFAHARNLCARQCQSEWLLALDPDEILLAHGAARLRQMIHEWPDHDCFLFPRKNWLDIEMKSEWTDPWPDRHPHLFKNDPEIRYRNMVHEELVGFTRSRIEDSTVVQHLSRHYIDTHAKANAKYKLYNELGAKPMPWEGK